MDIGHIISAIICFLFMILGLAGVVIPLLPGVPLAWLGLFIYAIVTGFERISIFQTVIFFILMLFTLALDLVAPMLGAKKYRASKWGIIGVFLGFIVGILLIGPWGIILGPFLGALLGELIARRETGQAVRAAIGAFVGFLVGNLLKVAIILIMMGFFITSLF